MADLESKAVLKQAIASNRLLAELKGKSGEIPNPLMLLNTISLQEAKDSSEIENIITTTDSLFQAFTTDQDSRIDPQTKEVLRYGQALGEAFQSLKNKPLSTNTLIRVAQILNNNDAGIRNAPGTHIKNDNTGEIIYTPPEGEGLIRDLLGNLEDYIHNTHTVDPLIKLALIHYQFEAIHPFFDGNGRTGRILNILYLIQVRLLELPILYLSSYIIRNKSIYYSRLIDVTRNQSWESWILFLLKGIEITAKGTIQRIDTIKDLFNKTLDLSRSKLPSHIYSKELIETLFEQPYCKVKVLVEKKIAKRQTAAEYLKECEKVGILKSKKVGREQLYLNQKLFELLTKPLY